jgi:hypothetical protein
MTRGSVFLFCLCLIGLVTGGCRPSAATLPEGEQTMSIQITSAAFREGSAIPQKYTCDSEDISPPLAWNGLPPNTKSLALIVDDPDAPVGTWVHWLLYDMPAELAGLQEGLSKTSTVQGIGAQGTNDFRKIGYGGPCPPKGKPHRYFFRLYALDTPLNLKPEATRRELEKAMQGHILAQGQLMGTYSR